MDTKEQMESLHQYIRSKDEVNAWGEVTLYGSKDDQAWVFWFSIDAKTNALRQEALNRMQTVIRVKHPEVELYVQYPSFLICHLVQRIDDSTEGESK